MHTRTNTNAWLNIRKHTRTHASIALSDNLTHTLTDRKTHKHTNTPLRKARTQTDISRSMALLFGSHLAGGSL